METKLCKKCQQVKPVSEFFKNGDGYRASCKICTLQERGKEYGALAHRPKEVPAGYKWCPCCKEILLIDGNFGVRATYCYKCSRVYKREYHTRNRWKRLLEGKAQMASQRYTHQNITYDPNKPGAWLQFRKDERMAGRDTLTAADVQILWDEHKGRCHYCRKELPLYDGGWFLDHKQPMSNGGLNIKDNVVVCCGSCNSSKRDKTYEQFCQISMWRRAKKSLES